mmetsp:Transcript_15796/g.34329  ORF Transcript_15796/g.34329 Transcript_15796/m.34329 type:complete len:536 (-) Transcript_15796:1318-2925(-)
MNSSADEAAALSPQEGAVQSSSMSGIRSFFSGIFHRRADTPTAPENGTINDAVRYGTINDDDLGFGGATMPDSIPPERPGTPTPSDSAQQQPEQLDQPPTTTVNAEDVESEEEAVQALTQRLRCLFTALTLPIIPIGTALSFLLLFVLYAAFVTDLHKECSAPLHGYAIVSLVLFAYAPNHRAVKFHLFQYSRERDGPVRPRAVRVYDQLFQTVCLLYVYGGMTLVQTCADDLTTLPMDGDTPGEVSASPQDSDIASGTTISTCAATCPALYSATRTFIMTLELFAIVLILPLLCLPCIYIWVVRRASAVAALAEFGRGRGTEDEDDGFGGRHFTALEILNGMDIVRFVDADGPNSGLGDGGSSKVKIITLARGVSLDRRSSEGGGLTDMEEGRIESQMNLPPARMPSYRDREDVRECCICMTEFRVSEHVLPEDFAQLARSSAAIGASEDPNSIVRTKCGHFFHRSCLAGWLGGRWTEGDSGSNRNNESRRARRRACPLCREDLAPSGNRRASTSISDRAIEESTALLGDPGLI